MLNITWRTQSVRKAWSEQTHGCDSVQGWPLAMGRSQQVHLKRWRVFTSWESHEENVEGEEIGSVPWEQEIFPFCWSKEFMEIRCTLWGQKCWVPKERPKNKSPSLLSVHSGVSNDTDKLFSKNKPLSDEKEKERRKEKEEKVEE